ncbi:unnamed protein product [Penicillium salamii]|uniref:Uncharacterized protein n=1 Tax=Penicillium salamii TaxID=1612424 RepID=A0A9W4IB41_9EURO|nr:unnamed protein product [Penicillium salamii]CAG8248633.1 unnamed protein product [Penicillium salamii]CAG8269600.1 unnamed protein product [Penicillium salamii]CAG8369517.1 unnamed protein product [Penicillium salamii]CAG8387984.1 unnamed protein product [Penicillium salamii]
MGESKSPAGKPDKKMSSHLLTMKFMQRAAASKEAYSNISPNSSAGSERHKPKRARLSTEAEKPRASDMDEITAALAAEEEKRQKALARAAEEAGETHWVLDVPAAPQSKSRPVVLAADSLDADDYVSSGGRQSFGNYKRKEPKTVTNESDDEDLTYNPADSPKEQERKKSKLERKQAKKEQKERSSDKNLGNLSSISGSGGRGTMMGSPSTDKKKKRKSR